MVDDGEFEVRHSWVFREDVRQTFMHEMRLAHFLKWGKSPTYEENRRWGYLSSFYLRLLNVRRDGRGEFVGAIGTMVGVYGGSWDSREAADQYLAATYGQRVPTLQEEVEELTITLYNVTADLVNSGSRAATADELKAYQWISSVVFGEYVHVSEWGIWERPVELGKEASRYLM